jgi:hypothetical protein
MENKAEAPAFWRHVERSNEAEFACDRWWELLGMSGKTEPLPDEFFRRLGIEELGGKPVRLNLERGRFEYEIERRGNEIFAVPLHGGSPFKISEDDVAVYRFVREEFLSFLAERNGFSLGSVPDCPKGFFPVGRLSIGGHQVHAFLCLDPEAFGQLENYISLLRSFPKPDRLLVMSAGGGEPANLGTMRERFSFASLPEMGSDWIFDRNAFCLPLFYQAEQVADQFHRYAGCELFLDARDESIFISGRRLRFRKGSRAFKVLFALAQNPSPVEIGWFGTQVLHYKLIHDPSTRVHEVLNEIREKVDATFADEIERKRIRDFFANQATGFVQISLSREKIVVWNPSSREDEP